MVNLQQQKLMILLTKLENELKLQGMWQTCRPSKVALASSQPFCCDTLSFDLWLQFIFIERLTLLVHEQLPLPSNIMVCPMAEEAFKTFSANTVNLINIIDDIDQLLSGKRVQTLFVDAL